MGIITGSGCFNNYREYTCILKITLVIQDKCFLIPNLLFLAESARNYVNTSSHMQQFSFVGPAIIEFLNLSLYENIKKISKSFSHF